MRPQQALKEGKKPLRKCRCADCKLDKKLLTRLSELRTLLDDVGESNANTSFCSVDSSPPSCGSCFRNSSLHELRKVLEGLLSTNEPTSAADPEPLPSSSAPPPSSPSPPPAETTLATEDGPSTEPLGQDQEPASYADAVTMNLHGDSSDVPPAASSTAPPAVSTSPATPAQPPSATEQNPSSETKLFVYGVSVSEEDDEKHVSETITNCLKLILPADAEVTFKKVVRFSKPQHLNRPPPIQLAVASPAERDCILKNARKLKNSPLFAGIFFRRAYSLAERLKYRKLKIELQNRLKNGEADLVIRNGAIVRRTMTRP